MKALTSERSRRHSASTSSPLSVVRTRPVTVTRFRLKSSACLHLLSSQPWTAHSVSISSVRFKLLIFFDESSDGIELGSGERVVVFFLAGTNRGLYFEDIRERRIMTDKESITGFNLSVTNPLDLDGGLNHQ